MLFLCCSRRNGRRTEASKEQQTRRPQLQQEEKAAANDSGIQNGSEEAWEASASPLEGPEWRMSSVGFNEAKQLHSCKVGVTWGAFFIRFDCYKPII